MCMVDSGDKSVLKCTIKKSVDVFRKVARYGLYFIIAGIIGAICLAIAITISAGLYSFMDGVVKLFNITISNVLSLIGSIPWYVYVGVIAILAIPVYSLIWCIAREFTEEDWESGEAATVALISAIAITLGIIIIIIIGIIIAISDTKTNAPASLIGLLIIFLGVFFLLEGPKILLFPGAYLHYRKRMKLSGGVE